MRSPDRLSFSPGSFSFAAPEGRPGARAWALRGEEFEPQGAHMKGASEEKEINR
jgi:hypothetical protein